MIGALPRHSSALEPGDFLVPWNRPRGSLEEAFRGALGEARLLPTPTGRHALWWFLEHADLRPGDGVLLAAYNYHPLVQILVQKGLVPVFVDVEPGTLTMDPEDLALRADPRCRMVLVTHMFGHPADLGRIGEFCRERRLLLFEDCAHAPGTLLGGAQVGAAGDASLFSFGVYKILNAFGGGMLALTGPMASRVPAFSCPARTGPGSLLEPLLRVLFSLGSSPAAYGLTLRPFLDLCQRFAPSLSQALDPSGNDPDYRFEPSGRAPFRAFMPELIRRQVQRLERNVQQRREVVQGIRGRLGGQAEEIWLEADRHGRSNASYFGVRLPRAREAAERCQALGIGCKAPEYLDCSRLPQFAAWASSCPHSQEAEDQVLRLPSFPGMAERDQERIAGALRACLEASGGPARPGRSPAAPAGPR